MAASKQKSHTHPQPTTVILVRHGENDWVTTGKLPGWTPGIHLNKHGRKQARATGHRLQKTHPRIKAIYASPLERTRETAQALAKAIQPARRIITNRAIGEIDVGDWAGKKIKKLRRHPLWPVIQFSPSRAQFPNGETFFEAQARAVAAIDRLVKKHPSETIVLVSHADIIKLAVAHYLGIHLDLFQRLGLAPASITIIRFYQGRPFIEVVNDTAHLPAQKTKSAKK